MTSPVLILKGKRRYFVIHNTVPLHTKHSVIKSTTVKLLKLPLLGEKWSRGMPGAVRVKEERGAAVTDQVIIKEEAEFLSEEEYGTDFKEPSCLDSDGLCGVSEAAALAGLYSGHVVKDELVLGPEDLHRPSIVLELHGRARGLRDCGWLKCADGAWDTAEEIHATVDYGTEPLCDLCGRRFTLKSDLMKHVMKHIYSPTGTEQEDGRNGGEDIGSEWALSVAGAHSRELTRECCVRLSRIPGLEARPAPATRAPARPGVTDPPTNTTLQDNAEIQTYACDTCDKIFNRKKHLIKHIHCHSHQKAGKSNETISSGLFRDETGKKHSRNTHANNVAKKADLRNLSRRNGVNKKKKSYSCEMCNEQFTEMEQLKIHIRLHTGGIIYSCEVCRKKFVHAANFEKHKRIHTGEKPFPCSICEKRFNDKGHLKTHIRYHAGNKPYTCGICQKSFSQSGHLNTHKRTHTGEKPFLCEICDQHFAHKYRLNEHRRKHTGQKPYACDCCNKRFSELINYKRHKRTHTGEKPYYCEVCKYRCADSSSFFRHKMIHTGQRPYTCEICKKSFRQLTDYKQHKRVHSGEKPYACEICGKRFSDRSTLPKHRRLHTGQKPFSCEICNKKFSMPAYLMRHQKTHKTKRKTKGT